MFFPRLPALKTLLFSAGSLLACAPAFAITNIENERPGPPEEGWSGQVELGLSGKSGNVEKEHYHGAAKVTWHRADLTSFAIAQRTYGETFGLTDTDETFLHLRGIKQVSERMAAEVFAQWQQDEFDNLKSRTLAGGGGRLDLLSQPEVVTLSLGLGAFREREELDLGTYNDVSWAWRVNSYANYRHQINPQLRLISTLYYQPEVSDFNDYRVLFEAGVAVAVSERLSLNVTYSLTHNSTPAVNLAATPPITKAETNTGYTTSLVYNF
jgi:putative salt-induced outer membrane protein YdiY